MVSIHFSMETRTERKEVKIGIDVHFSDIHTLGTIEVCEMKRIKSLIYNFATLANRICVATLSYLEMR